MPPQTLDLYDAIGGMDYCQRLSVAFHARVAQDPVLAAIFPKNLKPATDRLALFLAERLGGPRDYTAKRGKTSLGCRHAYLPIGSPEAHAWLDHMFASVDEVGTPEPAAQQLRDFFIATANTLSDPLRDLYQLPLDDLRDLLDERPELVRDSAAGRTLLSEAASRWDSQRVRLLLERGSDARAPDVLGHDALYRAGNAQLPGREADGRAVVEMLAARGADPNGRSGPGRLTPLHAAARRGTVEVAEALLEHGAEVDARDAKGHTPLRRAVNCAKEEMARLLCSRGADPASADDRGVTPLSAARTDAMRLALAAGLGAAEAE